MAATVLIVDDEKDLVELVKYHLEKEGLKCLEARDGETALQMARERTPDLMVLDLMLPGVDGLEVCRKLRKDPKTSSIAIIMLTAKAEEVDRIVGLEMGADDYMVKPFSPRELLARVKAVLRRGQGQDMPALKRVGTLEVDEGNLVDDRAVVAGGDAVGCDAAESRRTSSRSFSISALSIAASCSRCLRSASSFDCSSACFAVTSRADFVASATLSTGRKE